MVKKNKKNIATKSTAQLLVMHKMEDNTFYFIKGYDGRCFEVCPFGIALYEKENGNNYIHIGIVGENEDAIAWLNRKDVKNIISIYSSNSRTRFLDT